MRSLGERVWPPQRGYAISFWLQITSLPAIGDSKTFTSSDSSGTEVPLFSFENNSKGNKVEGFLTPEGILGFTSSQETFYFGDINFRVGKWYHLIISHSRSHVLSACDFLTLTEDWRRAGC